MKTKKTLLQHPTLVNDLYRISDNITTGSRFFRSFQGIMNHYTAGDTFQAAIIDEQINAGIRELQEAVKRLEALKKNYKTYATQL